MASDTVGWGGSGFRAVVREGAQGLGRWSSCISHTIFQPGDRDHIWKAGSREKVYEGEKKIRYEFSVMSHSLRLHGA